MIASAKTPSTPRSLADDQIPQRELIYHRQRLRNRFFDCILSAVADRVRLNQFNKTIIARRMGKDLSQISRLLSYPSNLTIDTFSDLLQALEADIFIEYFLAEHAPRNNYEHPWSKRAEDAPSPINLSDAGASQALTSSPTIIKVTSSFQSFGENSSG